MFFEVFFVGGRAAFSVFALAGTLFSGPVFAQFLPERTDPTALYQRVLADPANVDANIRYAQEARNRGDYEAAISVYERLLLFNPAVAELNYELGVLYFELSSYTAARAYFETALNRWAPGPTCKMPSAAISQK